MRTPARCCSATGLNGTMGVRSAFRMCSGVGVRVSVLEPLGLMGRLGRGMSVVGGAPSVQVRRPCG